MKLLLWLVLTAVNVEFLWCYSKSYENFKLYSVSCLSRSDVENIKLWEHRHQADFWSSPGINKTNNVLIDPSLQSKFEEFLSFGNFNYETLIENVGKTIKSHTANKLKFHFPSGNFTDTVARDFSHYWTLPEIEDYINYLSLSTDLNVRKLIIGRTTEGRKIHALTISLDETVGNQPILFIDAGIHAREWAGHMSVLYLLHQLVEKSSANLELLRNVDWVVVPVVNPDGFVYTFSNDRFWRKNRRQIVGGCVGVDINRNFGFGWKAASHEATPCSSSYPGPSPNSEPETRALADFMVQFKHKLKLYVSMHSYASFLLYPYSFDFVYISNFKQHEDLCQMYVNAVNRITKFEPFTFGQSANEFYLASAVSDDYAVIAAKAEMAIVVELPGGGKFGYDFPEENLEALLMETFEGLKQFGAYVGNNF